MSHKSDHMSALVTHLQHGVVEALRNTQARAAGAADNDALVAQAGAVALRAHRRQHGRQRDGTRPLDVVVEAQLVVPAGGG